jgi:gliding motility-associated-like protein
MKYIHFCILILTCTSCLYSQNLIRNPSFENYTKCHESEGIAPSTITGYVADWYATSIGPPTFGIGGGKYLRKDCFKYFDFDSLDYKLLFDRMKPYHGNAILGLPWFYDRIHVNSIVEFYYFSKLIEPLKKDSTYYLTYAIHFNKTWGVSDHFGATFINDTSQIFQNGVGYQTDDYVGVRDTFLGPDNLWHKITGCYKAKGGEEWILFCNLIPAAEIELLNIPGYFANPSRNSVILLDQVILTQASSVPISSRDTTICDGLTYVLPQPNSPNTKLIDSTGVAVTSVQVIWPNTYTYQYVDECFGTVGNYTVRSRICEAKVSIDTTVCVDQVLYLSRLLPAKVQVIDDQGFTMSEFVQSTAGKYSLIAKHDKYGDFGSVDIEVIPCENCNIYLPNVLKPRALNENALWQPITTCPYATYQLDIYDRWGGLMFRSRNPNESWDGTYRGQLCRPGVYLFTLTYQLVHPTEPQKVVVTAGDILLSE